MSEDGVANSSSSLLFSLSSSSSLSMIRIGFCLVPSGLDISYCVILSQTSSSGVIGRGGKHISTNGVGRRGVEVMRGTSGDGVRR